MLCLHVDTTRIRGSIRTAYRHGLTPSYISSSWLLRNRRKKSLSTCNNLHVGELHFFRDKVFSILFVEIGIVEVDWKVLWGVSSTLLWFVDAFANEHFIPPLVTDSHLIFAFFLDKIVDVVLHSGAPWLMPDLKISFFVRIRPSHRMSLSVYSRIFPNGRVRSLRSYLPFSSILQSLVTYSLLPYINL